MLIAKENKAIYNKKNVDESLLNYFREKASSINVISFFYNTPKIFRRVISYALAERKTVLYITNEAENDVFLMNLLKNQGVTCNYIGSELKVIQREGLNVTSHNKALYLQEKFDLVIYDDINSMPMYNKESIKKVMEACCKDYGTMISYSVETVFNKEITLFQPLNNNGKPLIEPRIINTRINVNEDLPLVVYDYLNWSIITGKKVVIYVPDDKKVENIYNYLINFKDTLTKNIFSYKKYDENNGALIKFITKNKGIMVTDSFENSDVDLTGVNVMVFFADDEIFHYKKLVYLSSRASRSRALDREEVIFLSNEISKDMDNAKDILRELNKKAWEQGLLSL